VRHTLHNGFPIKHHFQSLRSDCLLRNLYDNHSSIDGYEGILGEKVATDVQNSFACAFPCWILCFIHGLTLNAMGIDVKMSNGKIKHRLINDPSTPVLGDDDHGKVNMQLDKHVPDDVPKVFMVMPTVVSGNASTIFASSHQTKRSFFIKMILSLPFATASITQTLQLPMPMSSAPF